MLPDTSPGGGLACPVRDTNERHKRNSEKCPVLMSVVSDGALVGYHGFSNRPSAFTMLPRFQACLPPAARNTGVSSSSPAREQSERRDRAIARSAGGNGNGESHGGENETGTSFGRPRKTAPARCRRRKAKKHHGLAPARGSAFCSVQKDKWPSGRGKQTKKRTPQLSRRH